jgi:hypothetical protein
MVVKEGSNGTVLKCKVGTTVSFILKNGDCMQSLGLLRQWLYYAATSLVRFCFWAGLLWCGCHWLPIAIKHIIGR